MTDRETLPAWLGWTRLAIGVAQGVALYFINDGRQALDPVLHQALWITALFVPVMLVGGLGAIRPLVLAIWVAAATAIVAGLAAYGASIRVLSLQSWEQPALYFIAPIFLFVGHHLVAGGDEARKWIAPYDRYFDLGWRHGAQLVLAVAFTGAFWAVLLLGAQLFELIGISLLVNLLHEDWFRWPATCGVFAAAIHLTDLRSGMVRGARALGLVLLSWLLPAMTFFVAAFIVALPFTGLQPLWDTRSATAILLSAAVALVVLINAAYQDGAQQPGFVLRWAARIAAVLMTPLAVLAAYALWLRIDQYGLTPERIYATAILVVGACYAVAYLVGAFWPRWMRTLEVGNVASAFVVLIVVVAIFSPIADPARLSVADQMRRLEAGRIAPADFDVAFLRFDGARYGDDALKRLVADRSSEDAIALGERATRALAATDRWAPSGQNIEELHVQMYPQGAVLPEGFLEQEDLTGAIFMCRSAEMACYAFFVDLDFDGRDEVALANSHTVSFYSRGEDARWRFTGSAQALEGLREQVAAGAVRVAPARFGDLMAGDVRMPVEEIRDFGGPLRVISVRGATAEDDEPTPER